MSSQTSSREFIRKELYELVWSSPIRELAKSYGISDVAFAKTCRKANIPLPERGYWAKHAAGKPVQRRPLPPRFFGASDRVVFGREPSYWDPNYRRQILEKPVPPVPVFDEDMDSVIRRAQAAVGKARFIKNFEGADTLVAVLLRHDDERKKSDWSFDRPKYENGVERRRLLILNSIFFAVRRLGCRPSMSTSKYEADRLEHRGIWIGIGAQQLTFTLEPIRQKTKATTPAKAERLRLAFGSPHENKPPETHWDDDETNRIEHRLTEIVVRMLVTAEQRHRNAMIWSREHLIEQKAEIERQLVKEAEERVRKAREEAERQQRIRIGQLLQQAGNLRKAEAIRAYVSSVAGRTDELGLSADAFAAWAAWATSEADRIDPVKNGTVVKAVAAHGQTGPETPS